MSLGTSSEGTNKNQILIKSKESTSIPPGNFLIFQHEDTIHSTNSFQSYTIYFLFHSL